MQSSEKKTWIKKYPELEKDLLLGGANLVSKPVNSNGEPFSYIGSLTGYQFQHHGADHLYLFYDKILKKAALAFEYT